MSSGVNVTVVPSSVLTRKDSRGRQSMLLAEAHAPPKLRIRLGAGSIGDCFSMPKTEKANA